MPFHFCSDELFALMSMIPFIGMFFRKLHLWYHNKIKHKCHHDKCEDNHAEHTEQKDAP